MGEKVGVLHQIHHTMVATAIISSTVAVGQLHNRLQPEGYYKVSIQEAIVDDAPLMITNVDDDSPQLLVWDAIGTMTACHMEMGSHLKHARNMKSTKFL